jgi:hypothetical protein
MMSDKLKEFVGKTVIVHYNLPIGQIFTYRGIILDITETSIVLEDFKAGQMVLPLAQCQITEIKNE